MRALRLACVLLLVPRAALAQVPAELPAGGAPSTYSLAWVRDEGAESCPTGRELASDVTQRLGRSPFDENAIHSIEIRVERTATGFRSRVYVRASDGRVLGRRLLSSDEPSCAPLFSATALAVALLIDPDAALRENPSAPSAVAAFDVPEPAAPPPVAPTRAPPPPSPPPVAEPRAALEPAEREVASTSALAVFAGGLVPGNSAGVALHVAGRVTPHWGFAASALYVSPSSTATEDVSLSVGATAFGAFATFRPLTGGATLALEAGPWLGALHTSIVPSATGSATVAQTSAEELLLAALSAGTGLEVHVTKAVFVTARALLLVPLFRHQMLLSVDERGGSGTEPLWTQPPVAGVLSGGVGLSFF